MNETIYINKTNAKILEQIQGKNISQKIAFLIENYAEGIKKSD
jgi:hypothetical protein